MDIRCKGWSFTFLMGVGVLFDLVILVVTPADSIWYPSSMICTFYIPHFIRIVYLWNTKMAISRKGLAEED